MRTHRALGLVSTVLPAVMITGGLIVSTVRVDSSLGPDGDPLWSLMGVPIFSIWVLFALFYAGTMDNGAPLALVGLAVVTVMAARDIATASEAARRYNARQARLVFDVAPGNGERPLSLRLGVAAEL